MIDNFVEYMWYLLTAPLKKMKKSLNKWYILCHVFGRRFDEVKEDILRARDEGMVATCSTEMLPVHGADRGLSRYDGESADDYRSRISMYEEICRLGGTNDGVLLAVRSLGYHSPQIVMANDLVRYRHYILNKAFILDKNHVLEPDPEESRWAEFYIVLVMDVDEKHPISFKHLQNTVRMWKEVSAKDNYYMIYCTSVKTVEKSINRMAYRNKVYFYDCLKLDGQWKLDGSQLLNAQITSYDVRIE